MASLKTVNYMVEQMKASCEEYQKAIEDDLPSEEIRDCISDCYFTAKTLMAAADMFVLK